MPNPVPKSLNQNRQYGIPAGLAAKIPIMPEIQEFKLEDANAALLELKERKIRGAKVLVVN